MGYVVLLWGLVLVQVGLFAVSHHPFVLILLGVNLALTLMVTIEEISGKGETK